MMKIFLIEKRALCVYLLALIGGAVLLWVEEAKR